MTGAGSPMLISKMLKLNLLYLTGLINLLLLMWKLMNLFLKKKILGPSFSSELDWGSCILSIAKTTSWPMICPMKPFCLAVVLCLYNSTILSCLIYCFHAWACTCECYLLSLRNRYVGLLVPHLPLFNSWLIIKI